MDRQRKRQGQHMMCLPMCHALCATAGTVSTRAGEQAGRQVGRFTIRSYGAIQVDRLMRQIETVAAWFTRLKSHSAVGLLV